MLSIEYKLNEEVFALMDKLLDLFFDYNCTFMMREIICRVLPLLANNLLIRV